MAQMLLTVIFNTLIFNFRTWGNVTPEVAGAGSPSRRPEHLTPLYGRINQTHGSAVSEELSFFCNRHSPDSILFNHSNIKFKKTWYMITKKKKGSSYLVKGNLEFVRFFKWLLNKCTACFRLIQRFNQILIFQNIPLGCGKCLKQKLIK